MKTGKLKYIFGLLLSSLMIMAAIVPLMSGMMNATSATTYTETRNADGQIIRCQDGYLPQNTYDRIGLSKPEDMVIDVVKDAMGREVEYMYILNNSTENGINYPYIIKFRLDDVTNTIERFNLKNSLKYINKPTGLWIQTVTVNGETHKELYIADGTATYKEVIPATEEDKRLNLGDYEYTYNGLIYRIQFDSTGNNLLFNDESITIIHEPTQEVSRADYSMYELKVATSLDEFKDDIIIPTHTNFTSEVKFKENNMEYTNYYRVVCKVGEACESRIVELGKYITKTASFGVNTVFSPSKIAVDKSGNMFIASSGTDAGMIQLSYAGEFISFFVVNSVSYNFLYQIIKNFGTKEQLARLDIAKPQAFSNVFVDHNNIVYSVTSEGTKFFDKYSTGGSSILENGIVQGGVVQAVSDSYVTKDGLIFISFKKGPIYVCAPTGQIIFNFGSLKSTTTNVIGFFDNLSSIVVDSKNQIWVCNAGEENSILQTFVPTDYTKNIFKAITSFNKQDYEASRQAWEEVLRYDSLSVLANDGLGKAYYYDEDFENSLKYFSVSKNRTLYSNVFWELRNDFLQAHLAIIIVVAACVIVLIVALNLLFKKNKKLKAFKDKVKKIKDTRVFKDLTVGFRLIKKPSDTFYEMKTHKRGSIWGATIYYILALIAYMLYQYCYALPFQFITVNQVNPSTIMFAVIGLVAVFVLCNYLVSAINDGEGTFADIYKLTGYSLLPMIICLPISVAISYGLTLNEQVVLTLLKGIGFFGSALILVIGLLETHNYTFGQTVKNILLTIIFMVLFIIICIVIVVMLDQIKTLIEQIWREVKLRAGWY